MFSHEKEMKMESVVAYKVWVSGRVQGVFFRKYTAEKATNLGLEGFVQNLDDGRVYTEVQGEEDTVNDFLEWLWEGSPSSSVSDIKKEKMEAKEMQTFFIKR